MPRVSTLVPFILGVTVIKSVKRESTAVTFIFNTDIDECALGTHNCPEKACCNNTEYSYSCTCKEGYCGDGCICFKIGGKVEIV